MSLLAKILIAVVALEHLYILYFEMFAWTTLGRKIFKGAMAKELFAPTKTLAANQGLYNGFLVAGLAWSLFIGDPLWAERVATFFLACIAVAGSYGGLTVSRRILYVQGAPALLALAVLYLT